MATAPDFLAWARAQLGVVEGGGPHGNDGNIVRYWDQIHHHEEQGCPWCDAFVQAGEMALGIPVIVDSQYCPTVEAAYRRAGRLYAVAQAQPGDQVFFHFPGEANEANHTGILETLDVAGRTVTCIEGNTSPGSAGSQSNGGGVYRRTRPWSVVRDVGRPAFTTAPAPLQTVFAGPTSEDHVTPINVHVPALDGQGNGYSDLVGVDPAKVVSIVPNDSDPAAGKGYGPGPRFGKLLVGGVTRVVVHGGSPGGGIDFTVWTAA